MSAIRSSAARLAHQTVTQYARADVLRILRITSRQLLSWERAGLLPSQERYSFSDLLQVRKLRELCARKVRPAAIRRSVEDMRLASGMENPLVESSMMPVGNRVAFRHQGRAVEPATGQLRLDFDLSQTNLVLARRRPEPTATGSSAPVAELFARGVALEENPATQDLAIETYEKIVALEPGHAAAHINLGTLYYNRHDFEGAERHYRAAITADPRYALAYFDLGNVLDETGRLPEAIGAYETALLLAPSYADAHYNVALAYEKVKLPRKALGHWQSYVKLDPVGGWADHARGQIQKILRADRLQVVPPISR